MKFRSFAAGVSTLALAVTLGLSAPALAEGAAAGGNEAGNGENRFTPSGRDIGADRRGPDAPRPGQAERNAARAEAFRSFDRPRRYDPPARFDRGFERRGSYAYYNGHRGYNHRRDGYREYNGFWFPLAAFAAGALIAGAAQPAPVYAAPAPNPHVDWCARTYRSYNPYDNTFQPYHGPRAYCISPYS